MFGSKEANTNKVIGSNETTLIARGTEVSGEIRFAGCLEIEGVVRGNLVAIEGAESAQVRVQDSGAVHGDICAPIVVVNSKVEGNIYSSARVELAEKSEVNGDVHYQIVEMVKGAQINGSMLYSSSELPRERKLTDEALGEDSAVKDFINQGFDGS